MRSLFFTVTDRKFFPGTLAAINSLLTWYPDAEIAVVSSGKFNQPLSGPQLRLLESDQITVYDHQHFAAENRVLGAWQLKAYGACDLTGDYDMLVGFDSDMLFCSNVQDIIAKSYEDKKWRGGADGKGVKYGNEYAPYEITPGSINPKYMSTSCYFCPLTDSNRESLQEWALRTNSACYGPQPEKLFAGHGDQGVLNATLFAKGKTEEIELLPNSLWSQHWRFETDVISFVDGKFINHTDSSGIMRTFHCGGADKFWNKSHSDKRLTDGVNQRWIYAYFLKCLFLGPLSKWSEDPLTVIPGESRHLLKDLIFYLHLVQELTDDFEAVWKKITPAWIKRCLEDAGIHRFMSLEKDGSGSMNRYIELVAKLPSKSKVVEVGSFVGGSILTLGIALADKNLKLHSVESFMGNEDGKMDGGMLPSIDKYLRNIKSGFPFINIQTIPLPSVIASKIFEHDELDFVFIDANHSERAVSSDIASWWPKLKKGGFLAGDDYEWEGVKKAVSKRFPAHESANSLWWVQK